MPANAYFGSLPFIQQINFFRNKLNLPTEHWDDIWQGSHARAFVVAGAMKHDLLNDMRKAVDAAIADGKSLTWFQTEFKNIVAKHGWQHTGSAPWRANVIYSTNMRQSYNAGRWQQLQQFPYWRYAHGDSRVPRELHLKWHGTILPKDHPWWDTNFPQNGWGCKCRVYGVSQIQMDRKKLKVSQAPNDGVRDWTNKATGEVHQVPKGIDPGFDYNVGQANLGQRLTTAQMQKWQAQKADAWQSLTNHSWQSLNLIEQLPVVPSSTALAQEAQSINELRDTVTKAFGTEMVVPGPIDSLSVYVNSESLVEHLSKDLHRSRFIPLLSEVISTPQEVWAVFEKHIGTGKVELRLRYIKVVKAGKNKSLLLVAQVVKGRIEAWTFIPFKPGSYLNKQRRGSLLYSADEHRND
ncbi:head morphogenesis protein [Shewanella sp. WXL01]|uniref:PBECR2 nuclease fold domain-containing protein n=1 Tax=Shewanella sp. WXL01 TaxID=2709721 RepID=UPI0014386AF8|nr:PBECR2 nuclease fold domain-containing protein [Shewanella sp. WXL01]NKF51371.1 head morphogenesis protein [Shewanella sp. WXL01]